ncbi:FadR/GntR family transcriptional regulator [Phytoactinopolyspora endophytica]|uniref:FadR/GntR family transcriptional regulator n=1 Tax=Phytoactinopolyspora endophytica TaxID=1642495 RepID=UPI00101D62ED|nr:FadR/GntR family transcriptional regulator [Phytoactinopolyspora endophytica]
MPSYPTDPTKELTGRLTTISASTPTAAVASQLLAYFTSGGLAPGSRLPAERQLAEMLGTGRSAVREALAALEILGVVEVRPGSGTYLHSGVSELLPRTLSWGLMLGAGSTQDLVEIRSVLEVLAARLAAEKIDSAGIEGMREQLANMRKHADLADHDAFVEADARFHQELVAASENDALVAVLQSVRSLLRVWVDRSVDKEEDARAAIDEHARVLEAVERHDAAAAGDAMTAHMGTAGSRIVSALSAFEEGDVVSTDA